MNVSSLLRFVLICSLATAATVPAHAGPADKILNRYTKAQGKKALRAVVSTLVEGTITAPDGASGRATITGAGVDRYRFDLAVGETVASECYNGKSAWRRDGAGTATLLGTDARDVRLHAILFNGRFQDLSRHRVGVRPAGAGDVEGTPANALDFTLGDARARVFFDAKTGLPVKLERHRSSGVREVFFADYRRAGGVLEPHAIRVREGGREIRIAVERVTHNKPADESAFLVPRSENGAPLPDVSALFAAIVANQERIEELQEFYAFRETRVEREDDGRNGLSTKEERVFSVLPVAGRFVRQLVSVNGRELTPEEAAKEQKRVQKEIQDRLDEREKRRAREKRDREKGREAEADGDVSILTFLRITRVSSIRRETFRGQQVIALDFEPLPDFKPRSLGEQIVSKLVGTIWVDEVARQVVRLEGRLQSAVKIGAGLVGSLSPASAFVLEQEKVSGDLWLPSYSEVNLSARLFLFAKLEANSTSRFSDYRRYDVDSEYATAPQP